MPLPPVTPGKHEIKIDGRGFTKGNHGDFDFCKIKTACMQSLKMVSEILKYDPFYGKMPRSA